MMKQSQDRLKSSQVALNERDKEIHRLNNIIKSNQISFEEATKTYKSIEESKEEKVSKSVEIVKNLELVIKHLESDLVKERKYIKMLNYLIHKWKQSLKKRIN